MTPTTTEQVVQAVSDAARAGSCLTPRGGGTRSRCGRPLAEQVLLHTTGLKGITEHIPAELTVAVRAGTPLSELAQVLAAAGQWWPQAPDTGGSTVGGVISAAASGLRRLRFGPVRDSVLEVTFVTGDGRVVRGGGPTVKGVAGYDLPRLLTGARGTLGVLTDLILKLAPLPAVREWFRFEGDLQERLAAARALVVDPRRPTAIILTPGVLTVELAGASADVVCPHGFVVAEEPTLNAPPATLEVGVPPPSLRVFVGRLEDAGFDYSAQYGVGACSVVVDRPDQVPLIREWARREGGHAVVADAPESFRDDAWGPPPPGVGIMERMYAAFDPAGVLSPAHRLGGA